MRLIIDIDTVGKVYRQKYMCYPDYMKIIEAIKPDVVTVVTSRSEFCKKVISRLRRADVDVREVHNHDRINALCVALIEHTIDVQDTEETGIALCTCDRRIIYGMSHARKQGAHIQLVSIDPSQDLIEEADDVKQLDESFAF